MASSPILWIEVGLNFCLDFVPTVWQANLIRFGKYSFISLMHIKFG